MPHRRANWHQRITAVEREYWTAKIAIDHLSARVVREPKILGTALRPRDLAATVDHLEGTYLIRLFTEFEIGVRTLWKSIRPRTRPPVEVLLARVADRFGVPTRVIEAAQRVRLYRNTLVHDRDEKVEGVTIGDARRYLARYFAYLPERWGV